ncbi:MAG: tetraacyldisaccharide 4'-kinase [Calditrichaeota bacterium]|nr:MAG: tetraacyldisaccharide 4'-kinase [Calditrichota bacterium]
MRILSNKIWRIAAWPFSLLMQAVSILRNKLYDFGIYKSYRINATVISVGNISVGGTGKTPVIMALAEYLQMQGRSVAVLSRGYARNSSGIVIVSEGKGPVCDVRRAGDEPYLIASRLPSVPVVVAEDRVAGGKEICRRFHPEIILLDDGFQHRRLQRDFDIVLLDTKRFLQNSSVLPAGPYREGLIGLKRANVILLVGSRLQNDKVMKKLRNNVNCHIDTVDITSKRVWCPATAEFMTIEKLSGKKVFVTSAIGQPEKLRSLLKKVKADIVAFYVFRDHHFYTIDDIERLLVKYHSLKADALVTTWKDWVKIQAFNKLNQIDVCIPEHKAYLKTAFLDTLI